MPTPLELFGCAAFPLSMFVLLGAHIHNNHPTTPHGPNNQYQRISLTMNWVGEIETAPQGPFPETLFAQTFNNCACEEVQISIQETRTRTHSYTLGTQFESGGALAAGASALVGRLTLEAHASVSFNGTYTNSNTVQYQITETTTNPPCNSKSFLQTIDRWTSTGDIEVADHKGVCRCTCGALEDWYCNLTTLDGSAIGYDNRTSTWTQIGPCSPCPCNNPVMEALIRAGYITTAEVVIVQYQGVWVKTVSCTKMTQLVIDGRVQPPTQIQTIQNEPCLQNAVNP
jgi:hypothetical protein